MGTRYYLLGSQGTDEIFPHLLSQGPQQYRSNTYLKETLRAVKGGEDQICPGCPRPALSRP